MKIPSWGGAVRVFADSFSTEAEAVYACSQLQATAFVSCGELSTGMDLGDSVYLVFVSCGGLFSSPFLSGKDVGSKMSSCDSVLACGWHSAGSGGSGGNLMRSNGSNWLEEWPKGGVVTNLPSEVLGIKWRRIRTRYLFFSISLDR